jgi:hypothetical protein
MIKLAIVAGIKAFVQQAKQNHLDYCKSVVAKAEAKSQPKEKESK